MLGDLGFWVGGEYTYLRPNQDGADTEFSVDVHVVKELEIDSERWGGWEVLVECKYSSPGGQWVFLPFPKTTDIIIGSIWVTEDLATRRIRNKEPLLAIDRELEYCMKGIVLHDGGADSNSVTRGQQQLSHAMANLVAQQLSWQLNTWHDDDLSILLTSSLLVTNAPLFVLNHGSTLPDFHDADELESVATQADALVLYRPFSPHMKRYSKELVEDGVDDKSLSGRVDNLYRILEARGYERHLLPYRWHARSAVANASERVIVVNLDALPSVMTTLIENIEEAGHSQEHFATLSYDSSTHQEVITPRPAPTEDA